LNPERLHFILKSTVQQLKIKPALLSVVACLLCAVPLAAQDFLDNFTVAVGGGFTFPVATIADHIKPGFNFIASGGPRVHRRLSIVADFSLHYMNVDDDNFLQDPVNNVQISFGSLVRVWSLTANPVFEFIKQERFSSYATGGFGFYNRKLLLAAPGVVPAVACDTFWGICVDSSIPGGMVTGDLSLNKGGYNVGGGVTFGTNAKFFAEVRYHQMFTPGTATQLIPLSFGIRW